MISLRTQIKISNDFYYNLFDLLIKWSNCENTFEDDKDNQFLKEKKDSLSIHDNLCILNKSFSSDDEKEYDMDKNFEKILDDFNPKNYSLKDDWNEWFLSSSKQLFINSPNEIFQKPCLYKKNMK